jgi:hypothetical protein
MPNGSDKIKTLKIWGGMHQGLALPRKIFVFLKLGPCRSAYSSCGSGLQWPVLYMMHMKQVLTKAVINEEQDKEVKQQQYWVLEVLEIN